MARILNEVREAVLAKLVPLKKSAKVGVDKIKKIIKK